MKRRNAEYVDTWELSQASVTLIQCGGRAPSGATFRCSANYCTTLVFLHDNCFFLLWDRSKSGLQLFDHLLANLIIPFTSVCVYTYGISFSPFPFYAAKGLNYLF